MAFSSKISVVIFLGQIGSAFAQDTSLIQNVLTKDLTPTVQQCDPESVSIETRAACVKELCGEPGSYPTAVVNQDELKNYVPDEETLKEIDRAMGLVTEATEQWNKDLNSSMDQLTSYMKGTNQDFFAAFANVANFLNSYVSYRVVGDQIRIVSEMSKDLDLRIQKGVKEWIKNKEVSIQTDPLIRMRLGLNTPKDSLEIIKADLEKVKKTINELPSYDQKRILLENGYIEFEKSLKSPILTEGIVYNAAGFLDYIHKTLAPLPQGIPTENIFDPACKMECLAAMDAFFKRDAIAAISKNLKERLDKDKKPFIDACKNGLLLQAKNGQLPGQREKAQKLVKSALKKVTAHSWWSSSTKKAYIKFIQKEVEVANALASEEMISKKTVGQMMEYHKFKLQPNNLIDSMYKLADQHGNTYGTIVPFCPNPFSSVSDSFRFSPEKSFLHVSSFSCEHAGQGEGIVAHELGHALSSFISSKTEASPESTETYTKKRNCVNNLVSYKKLIFPEYIPVVFPGDSFTTEEDMADWFASVSVKSKRPIACSGLIQDKEAKFHKMTLELQPLKSDSHSPPLLRAIRQWQHQNGTLPPNCSQVVNAYKGIVEVKKCE